MAVWMLLVMLPYPDAPQFFQTLSEPGTIEGGGDDGDDRGGDDGDRGCGQGVQEVSAR